MTLQDLLSDIHGLDERLRELEQKYGMLTDDMYMLYRLGELEQSKDLIRWVGYCELRQERQKAYTDALRERWVQLRQSQSGMPIPLPLVAA